MTEGLETDPVTLQSPMLLSIAVSSNTSQDSLNMSQERPQKLLAHSTLLREPKGAALELALLSLHENKQLVLHPRSVTAWL